MYHLYVSPLWFHGLSWELYYLHIILKIMNVKSDLKKSRNQRAEALGETVLFSIYAPRSPAPGQLSGTTENSKLPLKFKTVLLLLFSWWIVYWRQRRAEGSELIQAIRRVLCKFRTTQGLAVASSGQPSKKLNKIITVTGDGFSLLFLLCQLQNNHCLKRIGRVPSVLRGDLESPASRWP